MNYQQVINEIKGTYFIIHHFINTSIREELAMLITEHGGSVLNLFGSPPRHVPYILIHSFTDFVDVINVAREYVDAQTLRHYHVYLNAMVKTNLDHPERDILDQHRSVVLADTLVGYADGISNKRYSIASVSTGTHFKEGRTVHSLEMDLIENPGIHLDTEDEDLDETHSTPAALGILMPEIRITSNPFAGLQVMVDADSLQDAEMLAGIAKMLAAWEVYAHDSYVHDPEGDLKPLMKSDVKKINVLLTTANIQGRGFESVRRKWGDRVKVVRVSDLAECFESLQDFTTALVYSKDVEPEVHIVMSEE